MLVHSGGLLNSAGGLGRGRRLTPNGKLCVSMMLLVSSAVSLSCSRSEHSRRDSEPAVVPTVTVDATARASDGGEITSVEAVPRADQTFMHSGLGPPMPQPDVLLDADPNPNGATMGKPLFECGYVSLAWTNTAYGHVLDDRGQIWFYDLGESWSPQQGPNGLFLESGLRARFKNPVLQWLRVPEARLANMRQKVQLAVHGRIERTHFADDLGGSGCEAFLWEQPDAYRAVALGTAGGIMVRNTSAAALQLQVWLQDELGMGSFPAAQRRPRQNTRPAQPSRKSGTPNTAGSAH